MPRVNLDMHSEHPPARRFLVAVVAPLIVAAVMQLSWPILQQSPVALFVLVVMFSAWYGGLNPSLISVIISILLADYLFIAPYLRLWPLAARDMEYVLGLGVVGSLISMMSELLHRARRHAEGALVITYDKDLRVTFIAGNGVAETGSAAEFFTGKLLNEIAPAEVVSFVEPRFRAAFAGLTEIYECPFPDGRTYLAAVARWLAPTGQSMKFWSSCRTSPNTNRWRVIGRSWQRLWNRQKTQHSARRSTALSPAGTMGLQTSLAMPPRKWSASPSPFCLQIIVTVSSPPSCRKGKSERL